STWKGGRGIVIEGLLVRPQFRCRGIGRVLMERLAKTAIAEQCYVVRWEVLDWNKPAIDVYQHLGSKFREGWRIMQLTGRELNELAESSSTHVSKNYQHRRSIAKQQASHSPKCQTQS